MKKAAKQQIYLHMRILQSGTTLTSFERAMKRENLKLTSSGTGPLALPYYPIANNHYEFLQCSKGSAKLIVDHSWEGFATSGGELIRVSKQEKGQSIIPMSKGDYASITHNDLRIMIRLTNEKPKAAKKRSFFVNKSYKSSFSSLFVGSANEKLSLAVAAVVAFIIVGGFGFGLLKRVPFIPKNLAEVRPEFSIPFVSPAHFETAPEALQMNYDRLNPVKSVIDYYGAVTENFIGSDIAKPSLLFPTSIERSQEQHRAVDEALKKYREAQVDSRAHIAARGKSAMIAIPAVIGESMVGSMRRIIDKVKIMHESQALVLEKRRQITAIFPKITEYTLDYRGVAPSNEILKKFGESVSAAFNPASSEGQMYTDAANLAKSAIVAQSHLKPSEAEFEEPIKFNYASTIATYLSDIDFKTLDDRLRSMDGVAYSPKPQKIAVAPAPKVGTIEKSLVEKFINQHKFQLQICYEQSLRRNDKSIGTMEWRWTINSRGTVSGVELARSSIKDKKLERCIKDKMKTWQFPNPKNGSVEISYPFVFSPNKG